MAQRKASASARQPVRRKVRELTSAAYREAILEAAERTFVQVGFRDAKMSDVAEAAGVSIGTLYNYFENKESVFESLVARGREEFVEALEQATCGVSDPLARAKATVRTVLELVEQRGAMVSLFIQLGAITESDIRAVCGPEMETVYLRYLGLLGEALSAAVQADELRKDVPVALLCSALAGSVNAAIFGWMHGSRDQGLGDSTDAIFSLFLEGATPR